MDQFSHEEMKIQSIVNRNLGLVWEDDRFLPLGIEQVQTDSAVGQAPRIIITALVGDTDELAEVVRKYSPLWAYGPDEIVILEKGERWDPINREVIKPQA